MASKETNKTRVTTENYYLWLHFSWTQSYSQAVSVIVFCFVPTLAGQAQVALWILLLSKGEVPRYKRSASIHYAKISHNKRLHNDVGCMQRLAFMIWTFDLERFFSTGHKKLIHKRRENVRGGEPVNVWRNTTIKGIMLLCGCCESELLACDQGWIHSDFSVNGRRNGSKQNETGLNIPEFFQ